MSEEFQRRSTDVRNQLISSWSGAVMVVLLILTWGLMGQNLPNISASLTADEVAAHYAEHGMMIRTGMVLALVIIGLLIVWSAQITAVMQRIERRSRVLSYSQLIGGALTVLVCSLSCVFWIAATYRTRSPETVQLLHDLGWIGIDPLYICTAVQAISIGVLGLQDTRTRPIFPQWFCWFCIWTGITFFPISLMCFFKDGPFAWNGLLGFWLPYGCWAIWILMQSYFTARAVLRLEREELSIAEPSRSATVPRKRSDAGVAGASAPA